MTIREFQKLIEELYYARDAGRGRDRTFLWFIEEIGELSRALARPRDDGGKNLREEFADVFAWLVSLASIAGVDVEAAAAEKYGRGCPKCGRTPCAC
jgi:NTP pyrophosphatase (non-canonical NTP hydrolase)